jgi:hypothetical protein
MKQIFHFFEKTFLKLEIKTGLNSLFIVVVKFGFDGQQQYLILPVANIRTIIRN